MTINVVKSEEERFSYNSKGAAAKGVAQKLVEYISGLSIYTVLSDTSEKYSAYIAIDNSDMVLWFYNSSQIIYIYLCPIIDGNVITDPANIVLLEQEIYGAYANKTCVYQKTKINDSIEIFHFSHDEGRLDICKSKFVSQYDNTEWVCFTITDSWGIPPNWYFCHNKNIYKTSIGYLSGFSDGCPENMITLFPVYLYNSSVFLGMPKLGEFQIYNAPSFTGSKDRIYTIGDKQYYCIGGSATRCYIG